MIASVVELSFVKQQHRRPGLTLPHVYNCKHAVLSLCYLVCEHLPSSSVAPAAFSMLLHIPFVVMIRVMLTLCVQLENTLYESQQLL